VVGSPLEISAENRVQKVGRKALRIPRGAVLIPRRYGPLKRAIVMQVYENAHDALRSRHGVSAYYGRPGRGALYRVQNVIAKLHADAISCPDENAASRLGELACRFEAGAYSKGRLISRLDIWHSALLLAFADDLLRLRDVRKAIDGFRKGEPVSPTGLLVQAAALRLAPFAGIESGINILAGAGSDTLVFANANEEQRTAADDLMSEIDAKLLRSEFEQVHCEAKTIERGMIDDADRHLSFEDGRFYVRFIDGLIPTLEGLGARMPEKHQKLTIVTITDSLRTARRALNILGLTKGVLDLFRKTRGLMKALSENLA
jgi:hypothetical protein